jgi:hypothetical protein
MKAKRIGGKTVMDVKEVIVCAKAPGWEWFTTEIDDDDIRYVFVQSPLCCEGEFGSFSLSEIRTVGEPMIENTNLQNCLAPQGWEWVKEGEEDE